jgi:hypothetical protein
VLKQLADAIPGGWAAISVRGRIENPVTTKQAQLPILSPALELLKRSMEGGQMPRPMARPFGR